MDSNFDAALKLHRYLVDHHWDGRALVGPDPGIRFNYRIGRFLKSYLPGIDWRDDYYYLQAQGYWLLANWQLFLSTGEEGYRSIALECSWEMLARQREDGAWIYPNREWAGRIATAEGSWASLGLLESFRQTSDPAFLAGALRWHRFLVEIIGFQRICDELAVNYFAYRQGPRVPNNSAFVLRLLGELAQLTRSGEYLRPAAGMVAFLRSAQKASGEFPYTVDGVVVRDTRPHFQCYQYNAFQCLDLMGYHEATGDTAALPLIERGLAFLRSGVAVDGHAMYECGNRYRKVAYHAAALAAAFSRAGQMGMEGYRDVAERGYRYLLGQQLPHGEFPYSREDYRLLADRRSYPRYLAMILHHLLLPISSSVRETAAKEEAHESVR
ncbi:MAG: hypothetical protein ACYC66_01670 [Chloroflexota bacterium]